MERAKERGRGGRGQGKRIGERAKESGVKEVNRGSSAADKCKKIPQNSLLNHASIKFGTDILKGPLFHKKALAMPKFKMAAFFQDGCHSLASCLIFANMGATDAFSMVSNPIQPPICSSSIVIFVTLAIPSTKTKMASNMVAKSIINLISAAVTGHSELFFYL